MLNKLSERGSTLCPKKSKTRLKVAVTVACAAVLALGAVMAILTSTDTATNKFELAEELNIKVVEAQWEAADDTDGDGVPDMAEGILPTQNIIKDPAIQNTTGVSAYIFADVTVPVRNVVTQNADGTYNAAADTQLFTYTVNEGWTLVETIEGDGCITYKYMYANPIANDTTATVFDSVTYANVADDSITGAELLKEVIVNGYAIQEEGFDTVENAYNKTYPQETYAALYGNTLVLGEASEIPTAYNGVALTKAYDSGSTIETASYTSSNSPEWRADAGTITSVAVVDEIQPTSLAYFFADLNNMVSADVAKIDTSNVTSMRLTFLKCRQLTTLDLSSWNTANVTDMYGIFHSCDQLQTITGIESLNTSSVTDMTSMFYCCQDLDTLDLSNWDTSSVTSMHVMFGMYNSDPAFSGVDSHLTAVDFSNWDTSNVTDMSGMFNDCQQLQTIVGIGELNTSSVTDMTAMFGNCLDLTSLNLSNWDTSNVTNMTGMFNMYATTTDKVSQLTTLDLSSWSVSKVTSMHTMFQSCVNLTNLDLSGWNPSSVTDMTQMFCSCEKLPTITGHEGFRTSKASTMIGMFYCCYALKTLDLSNWDTSSVTDISFMFQACQNLTSIGDFSNWDTSKVTAINNMFSFCLSLTAVPGIEDFNTSNVTTMNNMFYCCWQLTTLNFSNWDTSNVTDMSYMFGMYCSAGSGANSHLTTVDFSGWNTAKVTTMYAMFNDCQKLTTVYVGDNWNTANVSNSTGMLTNCSKLIGGNGSTYSSSYTTKTYARADTPSQKGYFTQYYWITGSISNGSVTNNQQGITPGGSSEEMVFTPAEGYTISGIKINNTSQTVSNTSSYTYPAQSNVNTYAHVVVTTQGVTYNVTYNANGGEGEDVTNTATYGSSYTISDDTFTKLGYSFVGWNTEPDGTGTDYAAGTTAYNLCSTSGGTFTLYAKWSPITYYVVYDSNGGANGEITSVSQSCLYDTTYQLSDCSFVNDGYTFAGWNTEPDGTGTDYAVGTDISNLCDTAGAEFRLYAKWVIPMPVGDLDVGASVFLDVDGVSTEFLVVNQGNPDSSMYDSSCDGTWLLMKDIYEEKAWDGTSDSYDNDYANSDIHAYLNNDTDGLLSKFSPEIQNAIQTAKIPYKKGTGDSADAVQTGVNGLDSKLFLPSLQEVGGSFYDVSVDGTTLSYFEGADNSTRVVNYNGFAASWWLRSVDTYDSRCAFAIMNDTGTWFPNYTYDTGGVRPALILSSDLVIDGVNVRTN